MFRILKTRFLGALVLAAALMTNAPSANALPESPANVRFGPLSLLVGFTNLTLDFAVGDEWTVGPEVSYWRLKISSSSGYSDADITSWGVGARANWFKNGRFTDGLYLGPSLSYQSFEMKAKNSDGESASASRTSPVAALLVGYGWFWDSFNIMLGIGPQVALNAGEVVVRDSAGKEQRRNVGTSVAGEFTLGWTF